MDKTGHMTIAAHTAGRRNGRQWMRRFLLAAVLLLAAVAVAGICLEERAVVTDFSRKNLPPCLKYLFGTDWMGRDMLSRTLAGLSTSIRIGVLASAVSAVLALFLGTAAAVGGKWADGIISWCIDLMMGVPHIVLLLLISYALGKGEKGVVVGVALTHSAEPRARDPRGDPAGAGGGVRWHCKTAWEKSVVHCQMAHFSADSSAVPCGTGVIVPARDPA